MNVSYNRWRNVQKDPPDMKSYKKVLWLKKKRKVYIAKAPVHTNAWHFDYWLPLPPLIEGVNVDEEGTTQGQGESDDPGINK